MTAPPGPPEVGDDPAEVPTPAPRRGRLVAAGITAALLIGGAVVVWPSHDESPRRAKDLTPGAALDGGAPSTPTPTPQPTVAPVFTPPAVLPTLTPPPTIGPTVTAAPGALKVSTASIDLGASKSTGSFTVTNSGGTAISFLAVSGNGAITVSPSSKILQPGARTTVKVVADRSRLVEGPIDQAINVTSGGTGSVVNLTGTNEIPPTVRTPQVGASTCSGSDRSYKVSVVATDTAGVSSVKLVWSGVSPGSTQLISSPTRWSGLMGPFSIGGTVMVRAMATDARGNTATSAVRTIDVMPCP